MQITIRRASEADQPGIRALVASARLNPTTLNWMNFIVADDGSTIVGAAQVRPHRDGTRELGSLIVANSHRGQGLADRLIATALAQQPGRLFAITGPANATRCEQWGFRPTPVQNAPAPIRRNYRLGLYGGGLVAAINGRAVNRLAIFERPTQPQCRQEEFLAAQWF